MQPHIALSQDDVSPSVILPGDPARVSRIAEHLEEAREVAYNREFRTVSGCYRGMPVTVTSTGIGGASMVIALEELIACGGSRFVRTGSCGASRAGIALGDLVLPSGVVREDGASRMYVPDPYPAVPDPEMLATARRVSAERGFPTHVGITRSHDSFYIDDEMERMAYWSNRNVLASDMETATLYVLASLRGVRALSILNNVVVYGEDVAEGIGDYASMESATAAGERREIELALEILYALGE